MQIRTRFVLLLSVMLAGCGGGSGDDDPHEPSATPTTVAATATPVATPTPAPFPEVLLGLGYSFVDFESHPFIVRNEGEAWERPFELSLPARGFANGLTFSSPQRAWLFGGHDVAPAARQAALLMESEDGREWKDVSARVPIAVIEITDIAFADAQTGYAVARGIDGELVVFRTDDAGASWQRLAPFSAYAFPFSSGIGARDGIAELVSFYCDSRVLLTRLDDFGLPQIPIDGAASAGGPNVFSSVGARGWVAFNGVGASNDPVRTRAAITTSAAPGEPWLEQPVRLIEPAHLTAIDVRDAQSGIAGGSIVSPSSGFTPLMLVLDADGVSWSRAPIAGLPDGWVVHDVLRARGDRAWAVANFVAPFPVEVTMLRSEDGGRTWRREPTSFNYGVSVVDLARNTERQ
jgi:photosystem II stability/assembly factor-like uncharacterized protein